MNKKLKEEIRQLILTNPPLEYDYYCEIDPIFLKIDYFCEYARYRLEIGIALLEGRLSIDDVPKEYRMLDRLKQIQRWMDESSFNYDERFVDVEFDDEHPDLLAMNNGFHRSIIALSKMNVRDRYFNVNSQLSIRQLLVFFK